MYRGRTVTDMKRRTLLLQKGRRLLRHSMQKQEKNMNMETLVKKLAETGKTISVMESCTGGGIANAITNVSGASEVFAFGAVTYSNEYKLRFGVSKDVLDRYTVYSAETAREMSRCIREYTGSDFGVGVTGRLNRQDPANPAGELGQVFLSVSSRKTEQPLCRTLTLLPADRAAAKAQIIEAFCGMMEELL